MDLVLSRIRDITEPHSLLTGRRNRPDRSRDLIQRIFDSGKAGLQAARCVRLDRLRAVVVSGDDRRASADADQQADGQDHKGQDAGHAQFFAQNERTQ